MNVGNRDNPIGNLGKDRLSRETQVGGFADFVLSCETPMTISIQGNWGTGKTSFVNLVMEQIEAGDYKKDIITPVEYQDEHDRRLLKIVAKENEDGWYEGQEAVDGWRNEQIILDGAQIGIDIYVGDGNENGVMAKNVYQIAQFLGADFLWYEDAYMKNIVHRGKDQRNHILDYLKDNIMKDVYKEYPQLFENPTKIFKNSMF